MQNKDIVQKTSMEIKIYKFLKKRVRSIIIKKSIYDSLTILAPFRNLVNVTLHESRFNWVKEFSALHHLQQITLSRNYVTNTAQSVWEWLELDPPSSNLDLLKTTNNDICKSSLQFISLKNYTKLEICCNTETFLDPLVLTPILDLSHNNLGRYELSAWEWLIQTPITNYLRKLDINHNYFTTLLMHINCMKGLYILISYKNTINFLSKRLYTLSQRITFDLSLSNNLVGTCGYSTWKGLETPIRDNLATLDMSYNLLTEFPLQITLMKNLRVLKINGNKIDFLPKELGTLPHLKCLYLCSNYLGKSDQNTWEWLEQASVRNNLSVLHLCCNLLTELPPQIGKLNALAILKLAENKLKRLPVSLGNLKNLIELYLCKNNLLYLPGNMAHLSGGLFIDVEDNPFNLEDNVDNLTANSKVPSFMAFSAHVILKNRLIDTKILPQSLVRYMNEEKYCSYCATPCFVYYKKCFIKYFDYKQILNIDQLYITSNIINASFKCYACSPKCAKKLGMKNA